MASNYTTKKESSEPKVQEFQFQHIPKTTRWESLQQAVWDPDKKEFCGRTGRSWYQLGLFYACFYAGLAVLVTFCMKGLIASLDDKKPTYILSDSLIGTNPGLGFRPISNETSEGSLIWYNLRKANTTQKWVELLDGFLQPYQVQQEGKNYQDCNYHTRLEEGRVCTVKTDHFGPCVASNQYGYSSTSPCVFVKLNKIFGWVPEFQTTVEDDMPDDLKELVETSTYNNISEVWISCSGENAFDKERIGGFSYFPSQGFPGYYFPYTNTENYLSPLIAVQILNIQPSAIVNIECRSWAKNIRYSRSKLNREGSIHFEILVDRT